MINYNKLKNNFFIIVGPNVIESEEHTLFMANKIKEITDNFDIEVIFKVSFDKANRSSLRSYRGVKIDDAIKIFKKIKDLGLNIITDIHEPWQADLIKDYVDIIQIPAFLCRQTDLLIAAGKTNKIIHIKKGQFVPASVMHKCVEKVKSTGNDKVILCERGTMFGYQDLIVDPRNLVWLKGKNLVTMDITHCLQKPAQVDKNGIVKAGGLREFIPDMAKLALSFGCNGIFMETHDRPNESLCDAPTQFPLDLLFNFIRYILKFRNGIHNIKLDSYKKRICFIPARYNSIRLPGKPLLKINKISIINRVYLQVKKCKMIDDIIVLTDNEEIQNEVKSIGGKCEIIKDKCLNGTERIVKFIKKTNYDCDLIINVQGDEPFINPENIDLAIKNFLLNTDNNVKCSTLHFKLDPDNTSSKHVGKVVLDKKNNIMYCSRNVIPGFKVTKRKLKIPYYGHIGMFVFDKEYLLNEYLDQNTEYQLIEDIEWLKILEDGYKINSVLVDEPDISVDTKQDYNYLVKKYQVLS